MKIKNKKHQYDFALLTSNLRKMTLKSEIKEILSKHTLHQLEVFAGYLAINVIQTRFSDNRNSTARFTRNDLVKKLVDYFYKPDIEL